jgi:hypothetical protein
MTIVLKNIFRFFVAYNHAHVRPRKVNSEEWALPLGLWVGGPSNFRRLSKWSNGPPRYLTSVKLQLALMVTVCCDPKGTLY